MNYLIGLLVCSNQSYSLVALNWVSFDNRSEMAISSNGKGVLPSSLGCSTATDTQC